MKLLLVITRWIGALIFFASGGGALLWLTKNGVVSPASMPVMVGALLLVLGLIMTGIFCLAPELIQVFTYPVRNLMAGLFYPNDRCVPPPDHTTARYYINQGRHDEALAHYKTIVKNHPEELLAYVEAIKLALEIEQPKEAEWFFKRGMSKIHSGEFKTYLWALYEASKTKAREGVLKVQVEAPPEIEALLIKSRQRVWRDNPNL